MLRVVNRVLLGLAGAGLVLVGLGVLLAGFGLPRPGFLPVDGPDDVLVSDADRERLSSYDWWWPTVIAVLSVAVLLGLWWLAAQLRQRRLGEVLIDTGEDDGSPTRPRALLRGRALEDVLEAEATAIEGVERASVSLLGRRSSPQAHIGLVLAPRARPGAAVEQLRTGALREACDSTGLSTLPAEVRLRAVKHRPERVT
ncbi:alkaline shock response membrane anchor protein AmaP [Streptomyces boninensis]|uniref:alkaline shock response membrane anchor protein AmaP n=1 Tax=Streptomyces boninensis TaxID=2039455 RepID=UPI003B212976